MNNTTVIDHARRRIAIDFSGFNDETRTVVEEALMQIRRFIPPWITALWITASNEEDAIASISIQKPYRDAHLKVCPRWFTMTKPQRLTVLLHELMHLHTAQFADYAIDAFRRIMGEESPKFFAEIEANLRAHCESATQDLTDTLDLAVADGVLQA